MAAAHAVVNLPKHGEGAHPEQQSLALDGRGRNVIAKAGSIDDQEHLGSLFWIITRTNVAADSNLSFEPLAWENKMVLTLPDKKKRKVSSDWTSESLPQIPLLVNKKAIKANTQLMTWSPEPNKK